MGGSSVIERFYKYHGLGNDFIILDRREGGALPSARAVVALCDRHRGIGADGVLSIWETPYAHARMHVQNADGSDSEMCGNGLRCVAAYLHDQAPLSRECLEITVGSAAYRVERMASERYRVDMGRADSALPSLPPWAAERAEHEVCLSDARFSGIAVGFSNPHLVIFVDDDPAELARRYGTRLEHHEEFPERTNVSFVTSHAAKQWRAVVFERGVGVTQACGSGACAIANAAVWTKRALPGDHLTLRLPGGELMVSVSADEQTSMEGEATFVFHGDIAL